MSTEDDESDNLICKEEELAEAGGETSDEETITSDERMELAYLRLLLKSKTLIFKTALAVLLVVLILLIFIYVRNLIK